MTQHSAPLPQHRPTTPGRIVIRHHGGALWAAQPWGPGIGSDWGIALATLDYWSCGHTAGTPPTFWLDAARIRLVANTCTRLGVRVEVAA